jgi:PKD repeat protein
MKKLLLLLALLSAQAVLFAQTRREERIANRLFEEKSEIYFKFKITDRSEIAQFTRLVSIDNVKEQVVYAYANRTQFLNFLATHKRYRVLANPSSLSVEAMMSELNYDNRTLTLTAYPTYTQYVALMQQWAADYPEICSLYNIGSTVNGRGLYVLKISDNINVREYEPQFLYSSTMHGDETAGYIGMLKLIDHLLTNYGTDPRVTSLVNNMEIWINPLANPDGTYIGGNNTVNAAIRYNGNNVDLNRNYWDPQDGAHPDGNAYQPETQAFMAFADTMDFVMSANFHGGAEVFNYPWDTKVNNHPDKNWFVSCGLNYVDTVHTFSPANYMVDYAAGYDAPGVTNGFAWYEVNGGRQDYMNAARHCREITIELSTTKLLPVANFETHWNYNKNAYLYWMEETLNGFHGLITDACTGLPVKAKVFVNSHDADSSHVYSSLPIGNYYRPIAPGTYSVTYSAPGYQSVTISSISVTANHGTVQDVVLQPLAPTASFIADHTSGCGGTVNFTDLTGSATSWTWNFGDGNTSNQQYPTHTYAQSGTYSVSLNVTNCAGSNTTQKVDYIQVDVTELPAVDNTNLNACSAQSFTINAQGSGTINWYDSANGVTPIATGSSYTTPVLSASADYYVENAISSTDAYVGSLDNAANGGFYTANTYRYLIFDVLAPFTLQTVQVNANTAGNRTIELRDVNGTVLQSATVNIPAGVSVVTLNFSLTPGTGYQLGQAGANQMYRNTSGASYPYTVPNVVSITGNSANSPGAYYYFYNWHIVQSCASARVQVHINVGNSGVPAVGIVSNSNVLCSNQPATFVAQATNVANPTYTWSVDGVASTETSATFTLANPANGALVECTVNDPGNCSGTTTAATDVLLIVTQAPATPVVSFDGTSTLSVNATSGIQWYLDGVAIAGANSNTLTASASGTYSVIVSNGDCFATSNDMQVIIGVNELQANAMNVVVYPNPANDFIQVEIQGTSNFQYAIYNVVGELVTSDNSLTSLKRLDVSAYPQGLYTLRIVSGTEIQVSKFMVSRR